MAPEASWPPDVSAESLEANRWTPNLNRWTLDLNRWTLDLHKWTLDSPNRACDEGF